MHLRAPAIVIAARSHGETGVVARLLTADYGVLAAYVAGGRGRQMRPVVIPGNRVSAEVRAKSDSQLPFAKLELVESRGPWLGEPLAAAAIGWSTALAASVLPERQEYPALYEALEGLLQAICHAPSARGWAVALVGYEGLMLRDLGYGGPQKTLTMPSAETQWPEILALLDRLAPLLERHLLAGRAGDVMAARNRLRAMLGRIGE